MRPYYYGDSTPTTLLSHSTLVGRLQSTSHVKLRSRRKRKRRVVSMVYIFTINKKRIVIIPQLSKKGIFVTGQEPLLSSLWKEWGEVPLPVTQARSSNWPTSVDCNSANLLRNGMVNKLHWHEDRNEYFWDQTYEVSNFRRLRLVVHIYVEVTDSITRWKRSIGHQVIGGGVGW